MILLINTYLLSQNSICKILIKDVDLFSQRKQMKHVQLTFLVGLPIWERSLQENLIPPPAIVESLQLWGFVLNYESSGWLFQ